MNQETLQELLVKQIRDIYDAEKQLVKALPKMAKAAESEDLAEAINTHLHESVTFVENVWPYLWPPVLPVPLGLPIFRQAC